MIPEIEDEFARLKAIHGEHSIARVEAMVFDHEATRHPLQAGAKWIMPGLSSTPWLDPYGFPELSPLIRRLESLSPMIRSEIDTAIERQVDALAPYEHYLMVKKDWRALYLHRDGAYQEQNRDICPSAWNFMKEELGDWLCPLLEMHFSVLEPGAVIAPHCDLWNFSVNLHLAVDIPGNCGITVANETRTWEEGKCLLFDYSYLHNAWNHSDRRRVCLLVDLWHPDLSMAERSALTFLIKTIRELMG